MAELEKILKKAIILRDIAGENIYDSGKFQHSKRKTVELICHNGHAWPKDLHFPQSREVHIYVWRYLGSNPWRAISGLAPGTTTAPVDQFALQDGRTYMTQQAHERLQAICAKQGNPELTDRAFGEGHAASIEAKARNGWYPKASLLPDVQKACVHGHGGLWNSMTYDVREVVSIDMKACYQASFQGIGEAKHYFERFGHPTHCMTRVAINGPLPIDIGTGFAEVQE
ncbi:MAG: hypothetical protein AB2556_24630 [Candidatus Thiodiazotropha sp.]